MSDVSKFNILGQIINIKDAKCREDLIQKSNELMSLILGETDARTAAINNLKSVLNVNDNSRVITVGKNSAMHKTINDAITHALTLSPSIADPVCILISPGVYTERIIMDDVHGICFMGYGIDKTIIQYNGDYPHCVVHVQGDINFENLTLRQLSNATYTVHTDYGDTSVIGDVRFINCRICGGSSAIGYGGGQNSELYVKNCILEGSDSILYAHNSPYPRTNQKLTILNNLFKHTNENYTVAFDDAGYSYGATSIMNVTFSGNTSDTLSYGNVLFRKHTSVPSSNLTYFPINDTNINFGPGNNGNSIKGLNYRGGKKIINSYVVMPSTPDTSGNYEITIPTDIDLYNYNRTINNVTIPGIGDVTSSFSITGVSESGLNIRTNNSNVAGKTISVTIELVVS